MVIEKAHGDERLHDIKEIWRQFRVSIVSDDWTGIKNLPLINISVSRAKGIMFFKCHDSALLEGKGR